MITSQHNEKLKEIRKLRQRRRWRERAGRFVAEGEDLLAAADAAGWSPVERFCAAGSGLAGTEVDQDVLASVSGLASGTRALAVYKERWEPSPKGPLCVYLHGVQDPGNVGAVLRSAEAFGAACVALGPGCADPFGPKAVRASMGAVFAVPLARIEQPPAGLPGTTIALVAGAGIPLRELCARRDQIAKVERDSGGGAPGAEAEDRGAVTLMIGAEREGLPDELTAAADHVAQIPIATDSLNAAMAATVALYELGHRIPRA
jgi:TrmH family RNA methyltransferase